MLLHDTIRYDIFREMEKVTPEHDTKLRDLKTFIKNSAAKTTIKYPSNVTGTYTDLVCLKFLGCDIF